jgi:ATP-dependent DNA ligase
MSPGRSLIEPCLPSPAKAPPTGPDWLHEIKHDGFGILARRDAKGVRLWPPSLWLWANRPPKDCRLCWGLSYFRNWHLAFPKLALSGVRPNA